MNKRLFIKDNFFKFKYQFFIFIFLLLFFNPLTVFAAGSGTMTDIRHGIVDAKSKQMQGSDFDRGGKVVFSSSMKLGYCHWGETEGLMKQRLAYEKSHGVDFDNKATEAENKYKFLLYILETLMYKVNKDITVYGDCMVFNEAYNESPYICTGWLYLHSDEKQYMEYAANMKSLGEKGYVPLYFNEGDTEGEMFINIPATYFYYPISSAITTRCSPLNCTNHCSGPRHTAITCGTPSDCPTHCLGNHEAYISQIYTPGGTVWFDKENRLTLMEEGSFGEIKVTYTDAYTKKIHDVDDFSGINGQKTIRIFANNLPGEYAWIMAFANVDLIDNITNNIGNGSYTNDRFPITNKELFDVADIVWNGKNNQNPRWLDYYEDGEPKRKFYLYSANPTQELSPEDYRNNGTAPLVDGLAAFMRVDILWDKTKGKGGKFPGFKEIGQNLGIDIIFSGVNTSYFETQTAGTMKTFIDGKTNTQGNLIDASATIENIYKYIRDEKAKDENFKLNHENIMEIYAANKVSSPNGVNAAFLNVNGQAVGLRHVWATGMTYLMDSSGITFENSSTESGDDDSLSADVNFARDTIHSQANWTWTNQLTDWTWNEVDENVLKTSNLTKHFSNYGNEIYDGLSDEDKLANALIVMQNYPQIVNSVARVDFKVSRLLGGARNANAIVALNELAKTNHSKWAECCIAIGDALYNCSRANNIASTGWSSSWFLLRGGGKFYTGIGTGINICQVEASPPQVSDLVMSNSYNYNPSTYAFENVSEEVQYNPTARNVIDWIHGSVFDNQYVGGSGSLPSLEKGPYTTILDSSSNWQQFDIKSKASVGSTIYGGLSSGKNNNLKLDAESNLGKSFDENPENVHFNTSVYVGRIPEANPEQKLYVGDIQVLAKSSYNQFELKNDGTIDEFNASEDLDAGARANIAMYSADGKANSILGGYFSGFYTDFNTQVLFKIYNGSTRNYYAQNILQVKATPTAILKASGIGIGGYNYSDYPEFGPNALNYYSISGSKSGVSSSTEVAPGDVVQFELDYRIPNSTTLQVISELNMTTTTTLLETGAWYQDYGQILTADVDYWIVPSYTNDAVSKFTEVNKNTNNDWVKMRINVPLMDNIYFTHANVCGGVSMDSGDARVTEVGGLEVGYSPQGGTTYEFEVNLSPGPGTTHYNNTDIYVTCNWRYWSKGRTSGDVSNLQNNYNFINYYNGFKLKSGKLYANDVKGNGNSRDMYLKDKRPDLTVSPNSDILNAAKDKSLRLQVPRNGCNDYTKDWEIIIVKFVNIPEKDNAVIDLVLEKGGTTYGNVSRYQGNQHEAQVIPSELSSANLYAVIKRLAPKNIDTWEETSYKTGKAECHFQITVDDGKSMREVPGSLFTGSIGGYRGIALADFDKTTECIIYKTFISGPFSYLSATANYRNKDCCYDREDINMGNNYWSEIWESSKNPNFVMDIVDGQANVQQSRTYHYCDSKPACNLEDTEVTPYLIVEVAQDNPNAKDTYNTRFHVDMSGRNPIKVSGHGSYLGSGNVSVTFSGGDTSSKQFYIEWAPMIISRGTNSSRNKTYVMKPYINYGSVRDITSETYILDNIKEWRWTANITCNYIEDCPIDDCCVFAYRKVREAKSFKGAGYTYYWDVVFRWSQNTHDQYAYYNQFVPHYWCIQCGSKTIKDSAGNTIAWIPGPGHMHCPCYCRCINGGPALNNGQNWWRNGGGYGYRGLGEGRYYETWNLAIMVDSSAHGERSIGTTYIYDGEDFIWWYETWYSTNRGNQPNAPYYPQVQPYDTKQGGSGHCTCNYLHRKPDARDITGPKYVDISCSGTQDYDYFYDEIGPHAGGGWLNKHFYWYPVPDRIFVEDNQIVCQVIKLYICVYDFHGHKYDTTNDYLGGQLPPGYNWYKNGMTQSYCDSKTGTIIICPSRTYIGSSMATEGLDACSGGLNENDSGIIPDGDVWVQ